MRCVVGQNGRRMVEAEHHRPVTGSINSSSRNMLSGGAHTPGGSWARHVADPPIARPGHEKAVRGSGSGVRNRLGGCDRLGHAEAARQHVCVGTNHTASKRPSQPRGRLPSGSPPFGLQPRPTEIERLVWVSFFVAQRRRKSTPSRRCCRARIAATLVRLPKGPASRKWR